MRVVEAPLNRDTIQAITQLIVERFHPEQIILFGSVPRGEDDEHSDLDLMVVLTHNDEEGRDGYAIRPFLTSLPSPLSPSYSPPTAPTPTPYSAACSKTPKSSMTAARPKLC